MPPYCICLNRDAVRISQTVSSCCVPTVCKYTVHERCVSKDIAACISTYAKSRRHTNVSTNTTHEGLHSAHEAPCY